MNLERQRKPRITRKEVAEAITQLKEAGYQNPSIRDIHKIIGHGSFDTISRYRAELAKPKTQEKNLEARVERLEELVTRLMAELMEAQLLKKTV